MVLSVCEQGHDWGKSNRATAQEAKANAEGKLLVVFEALAADQAALADVHRVCSKTAGIRTANQFSGMPPVVLPSNLQFHPDQHSSRTQQLGGWVFYARARWHAAVVHSCPAGIPNGLVHSSSDAVVMS